MDVRIPRTPTAVGLSSPIWLSTHSSIRTLNLRPSKSTLGIMREITLLITCIVCSKETVKFQVVSKVPVIVSVCETVMQASARCWCVGGVTIFHSCVSEVNLPLPTIATHV